MSEAVRTRLESVASAARQRFDQMLRAMPVPETMPFFATVLADSNRNLWVETFSEGTGPSEWTIFGPDGSAAGLVRAPRGLQITDAGDDWVLGIWKDEFDVEHVRLYRLMRS